MKNWIGRVLVLSLLLSGTSTFAQSKNKVVGYIDASLATSITKAGQLQWDKMTDLIYGFIQPDANGNLTIKPNQTTFDQIKAMADANGVNVQFSAGGAAFGSTVVDQIGASSTKCAAFATSIADLLEAEGMNGFDLDWEFPQSTTQHANHLNIITAIRTEFDSRGKTGEWSIAIAVGCESEGELGTGTRNWHTDYIDPDVFQYLDYLNLMSYDIGSSLSGDNHSSYDAAVANINDWHVLGCPKEKMILGVPFYSRHKTTRGYKYYYNVASSDPATTYNNDDNGTDYYNGKPLLQQKVDLLQSEGLAGMMIWEITYDYLDDPQYSLLTAIDEQMALYRCTAPDLGVDKSLCGVSSVTLSANVPTTNRTFSWTKDGASYTGSGESITVTEIGEYEVTVDSAGECISSDAVIVLATMPTIDLGDDLDLCSPAEVTLDASITGVGYVYSWEKGSTEVGSSQTLLVRNAGTYSITVNSGSCSSTDEIIITSSGVDVSDETICSGQAASFIANGSGDYEWYSDAAGSALVETGASYTTDNLSSSTTYYVKDVSAVESTTGPSASELASASNNGSTNALNFDALQGFTLKGLKLGLIQWGGTGVTVLTMKNAAGDEIGTYSITSSGPANKYIYDIEWEVEIPQGEGYELTYTGVGVYFYASGVTLPTSFDGMIQFNSFHANGSANTFPAYLDWVITTGTVCDPTPVTADVSVCTDIIAPASLKDLEVYPNPIEGKIHVSLQSSESSEVMIYDLLGVLVSKENATGSEYTIDSEELNAGIYLVKVFQNGESFTTKVIKN